VSGLGEKLAKLKLKTKLNQRREEVEAAKPKPPQPFMEKNQAQFDVAFPKTPFPMTSRKRMK
jgi:hypothetical protein